MNICFISNFNKTYFFDAIAEKLEKDGHKIFWVTFNSKLSEFISKKYGTNSNLNLNKNITRTDSQPIGDFHINELVYGDRVLRHETTWAFEYLEKIQKPFYEFIKNKNIQFIFGEVTWAHEILFHRMISTKPELNSKYLNPHTIRIPDRRFSFFLDEYQSKIYEATQEKIIDCDFEVKKPAYLVANDKILHASRTLASRLGKIKRFLTKENIDESDPMVISNRWKSFKINAIIEFNKEAYAYIKKEKFSKKILQTNYVFFALHKQPEASIDVIGRYYDDQYTNIINVWRALPDNWTLIVKEHSNAIGDRSIGFYNKLKKLRNLILIDENSDSYEIIKGAQAVVTVSGTVAYEAALMGRKSFTFAPCFFNDLSNCKKLSIDCLKSDAKLFTAESMSLTDKEFKRGLLSNSYSGIIGDPVTNPSVVETENIAMVVQAFRSILH